MGLLPSETEGMLLRRPAEQQPSTIDWTKFLNRPLFSSPCLELNELVAGRSVLITGAGGSIGSALAVSLMNGLPRNLILVDCSEKNLRALYRHSVRRHLTLPRVLFLVGNILDLRWLENVIVKHQPEIVFHAAALKHLAPLESNPFAALETNVLGTVNLLHAMDDSSVSRFVNVSSDKAVNPTSVLGFSKRIIELLLLSGDCLPQNVSVRLGNVLESSGSVVPLLQKSLQDRSPLRITDRRAARYFVTLSEAAAFLVQSVASRNHAVLLPNMGEPRTILDLALFLAREWKRELQSASFIITGLQDGEKLTEELTYGFERLEPTQVSHICEVKGTAPASPGSYVDELGRLLDLVARRKTSGLLESMQKLVPEFTPSPLLLRSLA